MKIFNWFRNKQYQETDDKLKKEFVERWTNDEILAVNKMLDEFDVPVEEEVYTSNGKAKQKYGLVGRIITLAVMVKNGEINTKLANKMRENMHHATDYKSERPQRDINSYKYTSLIGKQFKHFKTGNIYMIIAFTKDSETLEDMVSYQRVNSDDTTIWSRPFDMFFEKVERNGVTVDRFELVDNQ